MKKDILKAAGVKSEAEFYQRYPTEESFVAAHPEFARKMKMGGTPEAFPQTATMANFFNFGTHTAPTYLKEGGMPNAFPQAQRADQFFIPIYTDVYNPYNKKEGGSMPEMFPQVGKVEYQPPANMWFQEGGEPGEPIGVQNRIGKFMAKVGERAAIAANKQVAGEEMGMMKKGGNLPRYQVAGQAPGKYASVDDFVAENQLDAYTGSQFQFDPAYGDAFSRYIDSMYRNYYELDPDHTVYKQDPIYNQLAQAYGYNSKPAAGSKYNFNQLALNATPNGRGPIKSKGYVNGEFGRGRNDEYMWQTMFNTNNMADAQRLAAETGLTINESKAGLLGRRKKYTYEWGNPNMPGSNNAPATSETSVGNPGASMQTPSNTSPSSVGMIPQYIYQPPSNESTVFGPNINQSDIDNEKLRNLGPIPKIFTKAYGGAMPKAKYGLNTDHNKIIEKEAWWDKTAEDYGGMENFYQRQMKKGIVTDLLNMRQPDYNMYIEDMYSAPGTNRGTFDILNNNNMPYKNNYAVKDDFARSFQTGGNYKEGDVNYWDEDTINAFLEAGGQIEYLD